MKNLKYIIQFLFMLWAVGAMAIVDTVSVGDASDLLSKFNSATLFEGDTLYIPEGNYLIDDILLLDDVLNVTTPIYIIGDGVGLTTILCDGWGVEITNSSVTFENLTITEAGYFSAITVAGRKASRGKAEFNSIVNLDNVNITDSHSEFQEGGAIYYGEYSYSTFITNCVFSGNSSDLEAGAIYFASVPSALLIEDCEFNSNESDLEGGAIYFPNMTGNLTLDDSEFIENQSGSNAGAVYIAGVTSDMLVDQCVFKSNISSGVGAALYIAGIDDDVSFFNNMIYSNTGGYALYVQQNGITGHLISVKNNSIVLNSYGGLYFGSTFSAYTGGFYGNVIVDNGATSGDDVTGEIDLFSQYNIFESLGSEFTFQSGSSNNEYGFNETLFEVSGGDLVRNDLGFEYTLAKIPSPLYATYDINGDTRYAPADIGAVENSLDTVAVWTSSSSHDWTTASNWKRSKDPSVSSYKKVFIPECTTSNYPEISSTVSLPNADLYLDKKGILYNNGDLTLKSITVHSDSTGTGQYITTAAGSVSISTQTYEQQLIAGQWNFLCMSESMKADSLFKDKTFGGAWANSSDPGDYWISYYDELERAESGAGGNWQQLTDGADVLAANTGYIVWVDEDLLVTFNSVPGDFTGTLTYATGAADSTHWGWNLIGNPNSIAWDVDEFLNTNSAVLSCVYLHDGSQYLSRVDGVGEALYIPAHQAFFVQDTVLGTYTMSTDDVVFANDVIFKSASIDPRNVMTIVLSDGVKSLDKTFLRVAEKATLGFDFKYDAYELSDMSTSEVSVHSQLGGIDYSVNSVGYSIMDKSIPLQVTLLPESDMFEFSFELEGFDDIYVYLYDKIAGESTRIENGVSITKTMSDVASVESRFEIQFKSDDVQTGECCDIVTNEAIRVYATANTLSFVSENKFDVLDVLVYDLSGRMVTHQSMNGGSGTIPNLEKGIYIVKVRQSELIQSYKVMMR